MAPSLLSLVPLFLLLNPILGLAQLVPGFYAATCPNLEAIARQVVKQAVETEHRMAASILRLHFHDCFVGGCDGSVLLDDTPTFIGEKGAAPNRNSLRGFEVIDQIKSQLEAACPGVVSCADILALAARDSVVLVGGPVWDVLLGRKDSLTASQAAAKVSIPSPAFGVSELLKAFQAVGLTLQDVVALSGSHTIGKAHCFTFNQRLYNQSGTSRPDPTLPTDLLRQLVDVCPVNQPRENSSLVDLKLTDSTTVIGYNPRTGFDNGYFNNLVHEEGVLFSDQVLYSTPGITREFVRLFTKDQHAFFSNFALSMIRMANISPRNSSDGEIRTNCRFVNQQAAAQAPTSRASTSAVSPAAAVPPV